MNTLKCERERIAVFVGDDGAAKKLGFHLEVRRRDRVRVGIIRYTQYTVVLDGFRTMLSACFVPKKTCILDMDINPSINPS